MESLWGLLKKAATPVYRRQGEPPLRINKSIFMVVGDPSRS